MTNLNQIQTLTAAQRRIVNELIKAHDETKPLFVSELIRQLNYAGESSITPTLKLMQSKGWITIDGGLVNRVPRSLRFTNAAKRVLGIGGLPVLGSIPAGPLTEAINETDEFIETGNLLSTKPDDFLLRVKGDSMIEAGILNGDLALIRPNIEAKQGEIAAVYTGDEYSSTLKKVFFEANHVRLKPCNSDYKDILVPFSSWRGVAGVYKGLVRNAV